MFRETVLCSCHNSNQQNQRKGMSNLEQQQEEEEETPLTSFVKQQFETEILPSIREKEQTLQRQLRESEQRLDEAEAELVKEREIWIKMMKDESIIDDTELRSQKKS